jgi:hypothetical protein
MSDYSTTNSTMASSTNASMTTSPSTATCPNNPLAALHSSLLSGKFSDLTLAHGTQRWKAHKVVVCSQSPVLEAMIEALPPTVSLLYLDDYDHEAVCSMMEYLYSTNYNTTDHEPDFSLPHHIKVFSLSAQLSISGLEQLAAKKFASTLITHVKDLDVYFSSVKDIYSVTTPDHPALRLVVVDAAVTELRNLVHESRFLDLTGTVKDFQADIYLFLMNHLSRPVNTETEFLFAELCGECGPRDSDDGYEVTTECKGCGKEKTLEFF